MDGKSGSAMENEFGDDGLQITTATLPDTAFQHLSTRSNHEIVLGYYKALLASVAYVYGTRLSITSIFACYLTATVPGQPAKMPFNQQGQYVNANFDTYNDVVGNQTNYYGHDARSIDLRAVLQPVGDAGYDCGPRANERCHQGTRVEILTTINDWGPSNRPIRWLNGSAGSGKSAIARTVAHTWNSFNLLAGCFCFFRSSGDQSKASRVLPTVAFQLSISIPETKPAIEDALRMDPNVLHRSIDQQFQKLIVEPITALRERLDHPVLIVIDAVDECDDIDLISQLVKAITSTDFTQFPVRFLFTSRADERIRIIFHTPTTSTMTHELSLSAIDSDEDIEKFLRSQFHSIYHDNHRLMKDIPPPWPSPSELSRIVRIVNGSFIFASTLAKYVRDGSPPPVRLQPIVEAHTGVDEMYTGILTKFWSDDDFRPVFSTIILLQNPLSVTGLGSLLNISNRQILFEILKIQSILLVPDDDQKPVDIVHTSLRDFSTSPQRSGFLYVEPSENHLRIATHCLQVMETQSEQFLFRAEAAKYASINWIAHLHLTFEKAGSHHVIYDWFVDQLESFTKNGFQTWFNTVFRFGTFGSARRLVKIFEVVVEKSKDTLGCPHEAVKTLVHVLELAKVCKRTIVSANHNFNAEGQSW